MVQMSFNFLIMRNFKEANHKPGYEIKLTCAYTPVIFEIDLICMRVNDFNLRRFREGDGFLGDRHCLKKATEIVSRRVNQ